MRFATLAAAFLAASPIVATAQNETPAASRAAAIADRTATLENQRVRYLKAG